MNAYRQLILVKEAMNADPASVWHVLTHRTGVMFMGAEVVTDWHEGHPITFKGEWRGKSYEDKGVVQTFERERKVAFTHFSALSGKADVPQNYNLITVELEPTGEGTMVTLTQSIHQDAERPTAETVAEFEKNWRAMLDKLKSEAERR